MKFYLVLLVVLVLHLVYGSETHHGSSKTHHHNSKHIDPKHHHYHDAKHPPPKHPSPKHQSPKHQSPKHTIPKHPSPKHSSPKHSSLKEPTKRTHSGRPSKAKVIKNHSKNVAQIPMAVCDTPHNYCRCSGNTIECNGANLHTMNINPSKRMHDVTSLKMQHNSLTHLMPRKILPGNEDGLQHLDISYNELQVIFPDVFQGLISLGSLQLSYNHIKQIRMGAFNSLGFLTDLRLDHNRLTNLTEPVFSNTTQLEYLTLDFNPLQTLGPASFKGLRHLRELSLQFTQLSYVEDDWFKDMHNLETLNLRGSRFHVMPTLRGMDRLQVLDISLNPILNLQPYSFYTMPHLKKLFMVHMPSLHNIETCAFCGLRFLHFLEIRNCTKLVNIDQNAFSKPEHFESAISMIDLSDNALTTFDESSLLWTNASTIKLSGNPIKCDCRVKWIHDMLRDSEKFAIFQDGVPKCASPPHLADHPLSVVHGDELLCSIIHISTGRVLVAITICILIGSCAVAIWYLCIVNNGRHSIKTTFKTIPVAKYAYRNLAMRSENEDRVHFAKTDEPTLV